MLKRLQTSLFSRRSLTILLIVLGLGMVVFYGVRTMRSFRQVRYIQEAGFDTGDADADAIRPWMTIHFLTSAYGVPEDYVYAELGLERENARSDSSIRWLNRELRLGPPVDGESPPIIDLLSEIIQQYRANPVQVELNDVREWMSIAYIANSVGMAEADLIEQLSLDPAVSRYKPLNVIAEEIRYAGGPRALVDAVKELLDITRPERRRP